MAHPSDCACLAPLCTSWGVVPPNMRLFIMHVGMKINGLMWELKLALSSQCILSAQGVQHTLYASDENSYALARNRREKVCAFIIPRCNGGSHMCIRVGCRRDLNLLLGEPPAVFLHRKRTMTRDYAEYIRARQQIKRGVRLLLTQQDREALLSMLMCMCYSKRLPALPSEIREIALSFLNMSDLPLTHAIIEE